MGPDERSDDPLGRPPKARPFVGYLVILIGCLFALFYTYKASREDAPTEAGPAVAEAAPSSAQQKAAASAQAAKSPTPQPPQPAAPAASVAAAQAAGAGTPAPNAPAPGQSTQLAASTQTASSNGDLELAFNGHCRECHSFEKNDNRLGPSLYGVVGRKAGSQANFNYSDSVKNSGITWDEATLDKWITNPDALIPNNNMGALFPGLPDAAERAKIIAFLKEETQAAASIPDKTATH